MTIVQHDIDLSDEILMDTRAAARYLGLAEATLRTMRYQHRGPAYHKVGTRAVRYTQTDLNAYVERLNA